MNAENTTNENSKLLSIVNKLLWKKNHILLQFILCLFGLLLIIIALLYRLWNF